MSFRQHAPLGVVGQAQLRSERRAISGDKKVSLYILLYIDITTVNSTVQLEKKAARSGLRPIPGQGRFPGPA